MIVAGVMSGTSADGINVALVKIASGGRAARHHLTTTRQLRFTLLAHAEYAYPARMRKAVLAAMNARRASVADLARLNFLLGELYADAVRAAQKKFRLQAELIGCHGQTLYHQGEAKAFLGRKVAVTWQTGEGAILAARVGIPVVSDFRPADMAAGGKGAPLVPFLDFAVFRSAAYGQIVQNIGGNANLTAIPGKARPNEEFAFDTGPGNMVIDQLMQIQFGKPYDQEGAVARRGAVIAPVLEQELAASYFKQKPPKTAGREEFGREYSQAFLRRCGRAAKPDIIATATALTASSITHAVERFVLTNKRGNFGRLIVSGGGTKNPTLMKMLADRKSVE